MAYAQVFRYDEEGRLVKLERDYGGGNTSVAYEYGYNSDGGKVWKKDYLNQQEYRYLCRIGCGGTPMRVYGRSSARNTWSYVEDYLHAGRLSVSGRQGILSLEQSSVMFNLDGLDENLAFWAHDAYGNPISPTPPKCPVVDTEINTLRNPCLPEAEEECPQEEVSQLFLQGNSPCRPKPKCGYVYVKLECRTIEETPTGGMRCGRWSRWAKIASVNLGGAVYTNVWCRSRVCNRDKYVTQQCRIVWQKNCPPYDTRYSKWRQRICVITETNKQYQCCPLQQQNPEQVGCSSPVEGFINPTHGWIPGGSDCKWQ